MVRTLLIILFFAFATNLLAQQEQYYGFEEKNCITLGILQGGGSLIGADFELLLTDQFGFQVGAGIVGFGGGLTYHFVPSIRSSFISLQYWNQGIGDSFTLLSGKTGL